MTKQTKPQKSCRCPVQGFQKLISGKYKLRIIWDLQDGTKRYNEIRRGLLRGQAESEEIPARVLSRELKALQEAGLLQRKDYQAVPPKVEYSLTAYGKTLLPVIAVLHEWGTTKMK